MPWHKHIRGLSCRLPPLITLPCHGEFAAQRRHPSVGRPCRLLPGLPWPRVPKAALVPPQPLAPQATGAPAPWAFCAMGALETWVSWAGASGQPPAIGVGTMQCTHAILRVLTQPCVHAHPHTCMRSCALALLTLLPMRVLQTLRSCWGRATLSSAPAVPGRAGGTHGCAGGSCPHSGLHQGSDIQDTRQVLAEPHGGVHPHGVGDPSSVPAPVQDTAPAGPWAPGQLGAGRQPGRFAPLSRKLKFSCKNSEVFLFSTLCPALG